MKKTLSALSLASLLGAGALTVAGNVLAASSEYQPDLSNGADNFYQSEVLTMQKVTFQNQFKMNVTGNLYMPEDMEPGEKRAAIIG